MVSCRCDTLEQVVLSVGRVKVVLTFGGAGHQLRKHVKCQGARRAL